jgi:hypothetical protein
MTTPIRANDRDLRALAAIVSENRTDLPDGEGLPLSLLADLMSHIRCDRLAFLGTDSARHANWFWQEDPLNLPDIGEDLLQAAISHCQGLCRTSGPHVHREIYAGAAKGSGLVWR